MQISTLSESSTLITNIVNQTPRDGQFHDVGDYCAQWAWDGDADPGRWVCAIYLSQDSVSGEPDHLVIDDIN